MTADVHALAGAYALDALPPDECLFFERHLELCEACRAEVAELTETAAALGAASAEPAPPGLRRRVLARVDTIRQLAPATGGGGGAPRRGLSARLRPLLAPVAASLALAVVVLTSVTADLHSRLGELERTATVERDVLPVLAAADTRTIELDVPDGASARFLYSKALDQAVLVTEGLPSPADNGTYELWLANDGTPTPAAVFSPDADGRTLSVIDGNVAGAEAVAVTIEPHGGAAKPSGRAVASASL